MFFINRNLLKIILMLNFQNFQKRISLLRSLSNSLDTLKLTFENLILYQSLCIEIDPFILIQINLFLSKTHLQNSFIYRDQINHQLTKKLLIMKKLYSIHELSTAQLFYYSSMEIVDLRQHIYLDRKSISKFC